MVHGGDERRLQIERLCEAALARPVETRAQFLRLACGDDVGLHREVEALLVHASAIDRFPEQPLDAVAAGVMTDVSGDATQSGARAGGGLGEIDGSLTDRRLGTFEIGKLLGVGGMGKVYRARDTELRRDVALKVLPPGVTRDADRLARFEREARVLASLNHPNIAAIYRVVHADGVYALVLELVEGQTLADRLVARRAVRKPFSGRSESAPTGTGLSRDESLQIARQIALALEAAHDRGLVHRDLKPANVRITPAGVVKVLDFGLAKAVDPVGDHAGIAGDTRVDQTSPGMILGTAAYMAPEQAKGLDVDRRADLWAFGCVLFEMLAGRRPFEADSMPGLLAKVVNDAPEWQALPPTTTPSIRTLLRRCLEKDPHRRLDSAAAVRLELDDALDAPVSLPAETVLPGGPLATAEPVPNTPMPSGRRSAARLLVPAAVAAALAVGVWVGTARRDIVAPAATLRLQSPMQVTFSLGVENYPTWSPDGRRIAYHASDGGYGLGLDHDVWVSELGGGDPINLTNGAGDNIMPSWSPDGRDVAFFSNRSGAWAAYTVSAIGGRPRQVMALPDIDTSHWSAPTGRGSTCLWVKRRGRTSCSCCRLFRFSRRASSCPLTKEVPSGT